MVKIRTLLGLKIYILGIVVLIVIVVARILGVIQILTAVVQDDFVPAYYQTRAIPFTAKPRDLKQEKVVARDWLEGALKNFSPTDIVFPENDGNYGKHERIKVQKKLINKFKTAYGCETDPIVAAAHDLPPKPFLSSLDRSNIPDNHVADWPPRISLLFLIQRNLRHPQVWKKWFEQGRLWSKEYLLELDRSGNYSSDNDSHLSSPLFTVHAHISRKPRLRGNVTNTTIERNNLLEEIYHGLVDVVENNWGDLNAVEYQLLHTAIKDRRNEGFIFISDSTVPTKPFSFIYKEFFKNPRSRFFFSNVNLPLLRKHDQWIVLNRHHTQILLRHPECWVCNTWLFHAYHPYGANFGGAPDEYLPYYALMNNVGVATIQTETNDGLVYSYPAQDFNSTSIVYSHPLYRHTFSCWLENRYTCNTLGSIYVKYASPAEYFSINADIFKRVVLLNRSTWFFRKISRDCRVDLNSRASDKQYEVTWNLRLFRYIVIKKSSREPINDLPLFSDWLMDELSQWNVLEDQLWHGSILDSPYLNPR